MKIKHLFSESASWITHSVFVDAQGDESFGEGESCIEVFPDRIVNKSWAIVRGKKIVNDYLMRRVDETCYRYESVNPDLGVQRGTFRIHPFVIYSCFQVENTNLRGFEVIRYNDMNCFYADGLLYDGEQLVNHWFASMKRKELLESSVKYQLREMKKYEGRVPACGIFCGGCPMYTRILKPCPGAELNRDRCERCKSYHLCCRERGITHCYQCGDFPCARLKRSARNWEKYGQHILANQMILKERGEEDFMKYYNSIVKNKNIFGL